MSDWTLRPPTTPGRYEYRQTPYGEIHAFTIVELDGEMVAELLHVWMYLREVDGEWRRVLSKRQREKLELKGRA